MDDYNIPELNESKSEWSIRLVNILTPLIIEGVNSIFNEAWGLCKENDEGDKYLMTFQNFLSRVPKWNNEIVDTETKRIIEKSNCTYLEDLITCVHVCHLKILTCMRVGKTQKKIDVEWPKLNDFIHKVYINTSRKLYTAVFLFEKNIPPLTIQKNKREIETIVQKAICDSIRDSIPVEHMLRAYLDETTDLVETSIVKEELINDTSDNLVSPPTITSEENIVKEEEKPPIIKSNETNSTTDDDNKILPTVNSVNAMDDIKLSIDTPINTTPPPPVSTPTEDKPTSLKFNDTDSAISTDNVTEKIEAPKDVDTLEKISNERHEARKAEDEADADDGEKIKIFDDPVTHSAGGGGDNIEPLEFESLPPLDGVEIIA